MSVSDLSGTTWLFNETLTLTAGLKLGSTSYKTQDDTIYGDARVTLNKQGALLWYWANQSAIPLETVYTSTDGWADEEYRTITFIGGGTTDSSVIAFMEANAVQQLQRLPNKVVFGTRTIIDLTADTVTPETLALGVTAHNAAGELITGTMPIPDDYIVESHVAQGSNEWNWCKWASGKSEAWKNYDLYVGGWTAWGSMYESNQYANSLAFPSGLFIETPAPDLRLRYSDGGYALAGFENAGGGSASQSHNLYLLRPTSASATTWHLFIYYLGRWE